jgi:capsular polysaccharide biosynthesis protein
MELKEYIQIINKNFKLFLSVIGLIVIGTFIYFYFRPVAFNVSITLNISRSGSQNTPDYQYDNFYRLQADEKFSETVVEWLRSPRITEEILADSGKKENEYNLKNLSRIFKAEKRSSQIVAVSFSSVSQEAAQKISQSVIKIMAEKTANLNKKQRETNWFEIIAEDPLIAKNVPNYKNIFLISLLTGIFLGFWVVMIKHYWK